MQPTFQNEIMKARTADLHGRADQARLARAATQSRRTLRRHGTPRVLPGLRLRAVLRRLAI